MHQRRVDPIRQPSILIGKKRQKVEEEYAELGRQIEALDQELSRLSSQRQAIRRARRELHHRLWVNLAKRGRRAARDGSDALPPVSADVTYLWGRRLRARCREILSRHGAVALADLHAELHRLGFAVASQYPVKALGDALGYEADEGRVDRVARGVYQLRR